jgi:hypothetical protein
MSLRVLIFGTYYCGSKDKADLVIQWSKLHDKLNPSCDLQLVGSGAMHFADPDDNYHRPEVIVSRLRRFDWGHNIGHLSHGGKDGWGRDFCKGLQTAIDGVYDYVVHIEGDSLFRIPVMPTVRRMRERHIKAASVPIGYGEAQRSTWVETGLIFFDVEYLRQSNFITKYDWPNRTAKPQPEIVIRKMLGADLVMMPWKAERSDKDEITVDNVDEYDWITHCKPEVYDRFVEHTTAPWSCTLDPDCLCFRSTYLDCPYRQ